MIPYSGLSMEYNGYQRPGQLVTSTSLGISTFGLSVNGPPFAHSWLVPSQDLCPVQYSQLQNQHQSNVSHISQQLLEPGILELRKEKSRDAARSRRGKENYEFYELAKMLPLPAAITSQLDKASIIRLTISFLKLRDFSGQGDPPWSRESSNNKCSKGSISRRSSTNFLQDLFEQHQGTHILQSLDGFALAVAADGRFLYISETVSIYLGLSQVEMTGSSIFDYVHNADHTEMADQLGLNLSINCGLSSPASGSSEDGTIQGTNNPDVSSLMSLSSTSKFVGLDRAFCIRMKSTLTKRGCHFKSSGYRVVLLLCRLRPQYTFCHDRKSHPTLLGMVAIAIALPPPSIHEIRLESDMFVTRINFDFRIAHCDSKVSDLLDFTAEELTGKKLYAFCHADDSLKLQKYHSDLINKGQVLTHYYRILNKNGGYTWIQTCATVICNSKHVDEQNIICVNYIISGREQKELLLDCCQFEVVKVEECESSKMDMNVQSPRNDSKNESDMMTIEVRNAAVNESKETKNKSSSQKENNFKSFDGLSVDTQPKSADKCINHRIQKRKLVGISEAANKAKSRHILGIHSPNVTDEFFGNEEQSVSLKDLEKVLSKHFPNAVIDKKGITAFHKTPKTVLKQTQSRRESVIRATTKFYPLHRYEILPVGHDHENGKPNINHSPGHVLHAQRKKSREFISINQPIHPTSSCEVLNMQSTTKAIPSTISPANGFKCSFEEVTKSPLICLPSTNSVPLSINRDFIIINDNIRLPQQTLT